MRFIRPTILIARHIPVISILAKKLAKKIYGIEIDSSAQVPAIFRIPNNFRVMENVLIEPNIKLPHDSVIEANSHVKYELPHNSRSKGNPAQPISFFPTTPKDKKAERLAINALKVLLDHFEFTTVLDVGSGEGWHAQKMVEAEKKVTCVDFGTSFYFKAGTNKQPDTILGDFSKLEFPIKYDCIWMSHVLEHQPDPHSFLKKAYEHLNENGILAVTVPPLKPEIVGGHVNLFNAGLLLYRLILAGFNCKNAHLQQYGYNISVIVRKESFECPPLDYDYGDIERLSEYFPFEATNAFSGNIKSINWKW